MVCVHLIDNIGASPETSVSIPFSLAEQICSLIKENLRYENGRGTYCDADLKHLLENKSPDLIRERLKQGLLVYLTDKQERLAGCGMVQLKETRYEAKTLHVHADLRGQGYARLICMLRERVLLQHQISTLYLESLLFPHTIRFHQSRGFAPVEDGKTRYYSVLMKKDLLG